MNGKNIILNDSAKIDLTCQCSLNDILIVGNFNGMFGRINESGLDLSGEPSEEIINNFMWLNDTCRDAKKVFIGTRSSVGDYVKNMIAAAENLGIQINRDKYNIILVDSDDELLNKLNEILKLSKLTLDTLAPAGSITTPKEYTNAQVTLSINKGDATFMKV